MPQQKKYQKNVKPPADRMDELAAQYLDLWQDNLRHWATDPDAMNKWLTETVPHIKPSDDNQS
ncbi:MAG: hypothetical protein JKY45_13370 [Emcibacter sp.]|nr:hypothetical protein [Emcibacter sp.]